MPVLFRVLVRFWSDRTGYQTERGLLIADALLALPVRASFLQYYRVKVIPLAEVKDRYLLEGD
jgi:hypothetical protein